MSADKPPLLLHLERIGRLECLTEQERALVAQPDARPLSPEQQWSWIRSNRRTGFWLTLLAGGGRVGALAAVGAYGIVYVGDSLLDAFSLPFAGLFVLCAAMLAGSVYLSRPLWRRLREQRTRLPTFAELEWRQPPKDEAG